MNKILVAFYTHSGNTYKLAEMVAQKTGGVIFAIQLEQEYSTSYNVVVEQAKKEIRAGFRPVLKGIPSNFNEYGTIFVGTPNWWSSIAPPVATFLENCNIAGKVVIPFCTHGGGGFGHIERDIAKLCPDSIILPGLAMYGGSCKDADVAEWLKNCKVTG